ncbi:hypothetical protein V6N12_051368 [Hibiscus sabdariffa]|uniref:Uncharacterized protein n=1 Tax=Hibiscus sabdariffa TaxID=183260 RepID=A0ABR2GF42_9ROSI
MTGFERRPKIFELGRHLPKANHYHHETTSYFFSPCSAISILLPFRSTRSLIHLSGFHHYFLCFDLDLSGL